MGVSTSIKRKLKGNSEDISFVGMFLCVEGHIIIFREKVGEIIVNAAPREFDNGFFLCPKPCEGDLRVGSGGHLSKFLGREDMTSQGFAVAPDALDVNAYRLRGDSTGNGIFAMGKVEKKLRVES